MSYTDLRDFAAEYTQTVAEGFSVEIEKLGGGTVGKRYEGIWRYRVMSAETAIPVTQGQDIETGGMPKTHGDVVDIVLDCVTVDGMPLREWLDAMTMD